MKYTQTVDVWSCGCIMAELLTGRTLFPGNFSSCQWEKFFEGYFYVLRIFQDGGTRTGFEFRSIMDLEIKNHVVNGGFQTLSLWKSLTLHNRVDSHSDENFCLFKLATVKKHMTCFFLRWRFFCATITRPPDIGFLHTIRHSKRN